MCKNYIGALIFKKRLKYILRFGLANANNPYLRLQICINLLCYTKYKSDFFAYMISLNLAFESFVWQLATWKAFEFAVVCCKFT